MKTYDIESAEVTPPVKNTWESFVSYLESIYFEGAAELLDQKLICFEYNVYIESFS